MSENLPLIKRDISWLSFNERVLQEAKDPSVPLLERLKFLAIYSSNLDEFFRVRVASHRSFRKLKKKTRKKLDLKPKKILREIKAIVELQQTEFGRIFRKEIIPELQAEGIFLVNEQDFTDSQIAFARQWYDEQLASQIQLVSLDMEQPAPFLENKGLYLIVHFAAEGAPPALINIPDETPRFVVVPSEADQHCITFIDDLIRCKLPQLFPDQPITDAYAIKLSRDAELYIDDEFSGDLIEKIRRSLDNRDIGLPTRFLYDTRLPEALLDQLKTVFELSKNDLTPGGRYHNFNDFFGFPDPSKNSKLHDTQLPPLPHPELEHCDSLMEAIGQKDYMLHFPYQRYDYIPQLVREAAEDKQVEQIHITLYRVAGKSEVAQALLYAVQQGKKVTAFIEAKARFDEASNLYWGNQLKEAGAEVRYSFPGIKVHTKLLLISRREKKQLHYYSYLGTGNFNEKTARLYCDHALLTADQRLGREITQVFDLLEGKIIMPKCKHLLVSPFTTRKGFTAMIDKEITNARVGLPAYMILKMNSLEDQEMIEKLYEASQAGVKIQLIVRGICCLVPGVKGLSENIEAMSLVDRFLEHARVYIFANGGKEKMYTASADWMNRNLDRRVEVAMPIYDPEVYAELRQLIQLQLEDNRKARIIDQLQSNPYRRGPEEAPTVRAQIAAYELLKSKVEATLSPTN
ncbi:MAG: polyphosphate kinase 1 [Bacteroidota bacterium]